METYRISEIAGSAGVASSTVRYYERIGLLPLARRTASGYRIYTGADAERLRFIAGAKLLGLSLEEIAGLAQAWDGEECAVTRSRVVELVGSRLSRAREELAGLQRFVRELEEVRDRLVGEAPARGRCRSACGCLPEPEPVTLERRPPSNKHPLRSRSP